VKELAERYAEPMPVISKDVETLTKKVEEHLAKMGFDLK
jgi:type I restriction enzyme M protein